MYEYWIYNSRVSEFVFQIDIYKKNSASQNIFWYFQGKNIFVIQSNVPFGDGHLLLDDFLVTLSKYYEVHDKGIIKSHWHASSFIQ
jgi:hypothetical protein